jgi:hypothetical protein
MLTVGNLHQARILAKANLTLAERVHRGQMLAAAFWSNQLTAVEYQLGSFSQGQAYMNQLVEAMHSAGFGPSIEHAAVAITVALITQITGMAEE